jgi:Ca2+-binding EF-hand superfamily protein
MAKNSAAISNSIVRQLIDLCLNSERITRQEYLQLTSVILSNQNITEEDLHQINRVFDRVQLGRIKLIDDRP